MTDRSETNIQDYCVSLEALTEETLDDFLDLCSEDIEFRDPFNHTFTRDHFRLALEHMFANVKDLRFEIMEHWGAGDSWIIKWTFSGRTKLIGELNVLGLSEVGFDAHGRVCRHLDYWDASEQFLQKIPGLGAALRRILQPLKVS